MTHQLKPIPAALLKHARLSPSGAKGWLSCAGKIKMEEPFPNGHSEHSDKGTACHTVAAECLIDQALIPSDWLGDKVKVSDEGEEPRFVEFTEDLCEMVTGYVDAIKALTKDRELFVEQRVEFSMYIDVPDQFGTIDAHWLEPLDDAWQIVICDLKSGYLFVDTDSPQLKLYALGVLARYELSHDIKSVRLMIYQPRHGGMREEVISVEDLLAFAAEAKKGAQKVETAIERHGPMHARGDGEMWERIYLNPEPNEQDCAFCRAMSVCPSARRKLEETVGAAFDVIDENAQPADKLHEALEQAEGLGADVDAYLGKMMSVTGFLEDWIKAVRAEVERRLMLGEPVEGFGLELGRQGARAWKDEEEAERMVREQFRIKAELAYKMKLHSPTQLEKLAKVTNPTKKNPNPAKPVITPKQWEKLQPLIVRSPAVPSVKPLSQIKELYSVTKPDADAFDVVPETPAEDEQLW